jgi:putative sigma-54 modulation protein
MNITITGHHVEVTPALRDYVNEKLEKVHKRFANITSAHVTLTVAKKFQQKAEATLHLAKSEIYANCEAEDMYAAIDLLTDKLERQVVKHKEKMQNHDGGDLG